MKQTAQQNIHFYRTGKRIDRNCTKHDKLLLKIRRREIEDGFTHLECNQPDIKKAKYKPIHKQLNLFK